MKKMPRGDIVPRGTFFRDARLFVIAVEGEKTERQYFSLFESKRIRVEVLPAGSDGLSAPSQVIERLVVFEDQFNLDDKDELWLVWDVDHHRGQALDKATRVALESHYQLAISNPCFELWLRLHFAEADPADTNGQALKARLRQELGGYNWSNLDLSLYTRENIMQAIVRAKALEGERNTRWPEFPGTHVFKLVEKLIQFASL